MPELYRRVDSPNWYYDMTLPDGTRKRVSTRRTVKAEAKKVADAQYRKHLDRIQLGVREELTLAEALDRYLAGCVRQKDYKNLVSRVRKLKGEVSGKWGMNPAMKFETLSTASIEELRTIRLDEGAAENTIDNEVKVLSRAYHLARDSWGVAVSPDVSFPKFNPKGKLRWLTPVEEGRLLVELDPDRGIPFKARNGTEGRYQPAEDSLVRQQMQDCYDLTIFLLDVGARYSEVASIPWAAIDTINWDWVSIYASKTDKENLLHMTARLRAVLKRRREADPIGIYVFGGYGGHDDAEETPRGKATRAIRAAIGRAGLNSDALVRRYGKATVHTLRDTFASRLIQNGASLYEVQQLLGHSDPRQTQKYAKLIPDQTAKKAAGILDRLAAD